MKATPRLLASLLPVALAALAVAQPTTRPAGSAANPAVVTFNLMDGSIITGALSDLSLDIASAHITTFGEKVIDTFYVTDLTGAKIENPTRQEAVKKRLISTLEGAAAERSAKAKAAAE